MYVDYKDDTYLVPKNTSVIVKRVPIVAGSRGPDTGQYVHVITTHTIDLTISHSSANYPPRPTPTPAPIVTTPVMTQMSIAASAPAPSASGSEPDEFGAPLFNDAETAKIMGLVNDANTWGSQYVLNIDNLSTLH